jgi:MoxR-like ATPase
LGASPRGSLALFRAAQARALLYGRAYASPEDVHALAIPVLAHRTQLGSEARYGGTTSEAVLSAILREVAVPVG